MNKYKEPNELHTINELEELIKKVAEEENKNNEKHLKGYIYDSLVYRYQLALYKASLKDAEDLMVEKLISRKEAEGEARKNYQRDLMRFCDILNEAIGDHD